MIKSIVVACSENDVIGRDEDLPWHLPEDLRHFRQLTSQHTVLAGRITHDSIVSRLGHPLPDRHTVVVSTKNQETSVASADVTWCSSFSAAIVAAELAEESRSDPEVFIIGGASVYRQSLTIVDRVYLTRVYEHHEGDARMPAGWLDGFSLESVVDGVSSVGQIRYSFMRFERMSR